MTKTLDQLNKEFEELSSEREVLFKQRKPIDKKLEVIYKKLERIKEEIGEAKEKTSWNEEEFFTYDPRRDSMKLLRARERFAEQYCVKPHGYLPDTQDNKGTCQYGFSTIFYKNEKHPKGWTLQEQIDLVKSFFTKHRKFMRPLKSKNMLYLDIFESTLSEYGSWWMMISPDLKTAEIHKTTYGRDQVMKSGAFSDIIQYVAENLYYC